MIRRGGFTLLEVTVGIVLTGLVALLTYGAVRTATDTQERLASEQRAHQADAAWRALVSAAARSVRSPLDYRAATLRLADEEGPGGTPADRLELVTSADGPPLSEGADWLVSVAVRDGVLQAEALTLGDRTVRRVIPGPRGLVGMDVQALAAGRGWMDAWPDGASLPLALRITFWTEDGPVGAPLLLALPVESGP